MAGTMTPPTPRLHSERERLRRRRDRHARLATDRALAEVAFRLRAGHRQEGGPDPGVAHELEGHRRIRSS
jgi:hypothetical protein